MKLNDVVPPNPSGSFFRMQDMKIDQPYTLRFFGDFLPVVVGWTAEKGGKPVRKLYRKDLSLASHFSPGEVVSTEQSPIHYALIGAAYVYEPRRIQVVEIKQATIYQPLKKYAANPKYGDPSRWDVNITKTQVGGKTSYSVIADPPEDMAPEVKAAWEEVNAKGFDLTAMLDGGNPFEVVPNSFDEATGQNSDRAVRDSDIPF